METPQIDPARLSELYEVVCQLHASPDLNEVSDRTLLIVPLQVPDRFLGV